MHSDFISWTRWADARQFCSSDARLFLSLTPDDDFFHGRPVIPFSYASNFIPGLARISFSGAGDFIPRLVDNFFLGRPTISFLRRTRIYFSGSGDFIPRIGRTSFSDTWRIDFSDARPGTWNDFLDFDTWDARISFSDGKLQTLQNAVCDDRNFHQV